MANDKSKVITELKNLIEDITPKGYQEDIWYIRLGNLCDTCYLAGQPTWAAQLRTIWASSRMMNKDCLILTLELFYHSI